MNLFRKATGCGREEYLHLEDHAVSVLPQWRWCYRWHKSKTQSPWQVFGHHPPRYHGGRLCGGLSSPTVCAYGSSGTILVSKDLRPSAFFPSPLHLKDWTCLIFLHQLPSVIEKYLHRLRFGSDLGRTLREVKTLLIPPDGTGVDWGRDCMRLKEIKHLVIYRISLLLSM